MYVGNTLISVVTFIISAYTIDCEFHENIIIKFFVYEVSLIFG